MGKLEVKTALVNDSHHMAQDHVTVICCRKKKQAGFTKVQGYMDILTSLCDSCILIIVLV